MEPIEELLLLFLLLLLWDSWNKVPHGNNKIKLKGPQGKQVVQKMTRATQNIIKLI